MGIDGNIENLKNPPISLEQRVENKRTELLNITKNLYNKYKTPEFLNKYMEFMEDEISPITNKTKSDLFSLKNEIEKKLK